MSKTISSPADFNADIDYVLETAAKLYREGINPSIAILRAHTKRPVPFPAVVKAMQVWQAKSQTELDAIKAEPEAKPKRKKAKSKSTDAPVLTADASLMQALAALTQEIAALRQELHVLNQQHLPKNPQE